MGLNKSLGTIHRNVPVGDGFHRIQAWLNRRYPDYRICDVTNRELFRITGAECPSMFVGFIKILQLNPRSSIHSIRHPHEYACPIESFCHRMSVSPNGFAFPGGPVSTSTSKYWKCVSLNNLLQNFTEATSANAIISTG